MRTGPSANLPDCRAYELVSVPNSGGAQPLAKSSDVTFNAFNMNILAGDQAMYMADQSALPGYPGTGNNDRFVATRTSTGWTTTLIGPTGAEAANVQPGGISSDLKSYFFHIRAIAVSGLIPGTLEDPFRSFTDNAGDLIQPDLIRLPDGTFQPIGVGSLGVDPSAVGHFISPNASHIIFDNGENIQVNEAPIQLEPNAPANHIAIYDRSPGGPTRVVSLLPGGVTPSADATFMGASADGGTVAWTLAGDSSLYVSRDGQTYQVTPNPSSFAGIFGGQVFYADVADDASNTVQSAEANLFSFDVASQTTKQISDVPGRFVLVSDDGSRVYFVSTSQVDGQGTAGQQNLYLWDRAANTTTFVATVAGTDVTGNQFPFLFTRSNLAAWIGAMRGWQVGDELGRANSLTRATSDGSVLVFESKAKLTSFDNNNQTEIYRYDAVAHELGCVSCAGPEPATAPAHFETLGPDFFNLSTPLAPLYAAANLTVDGNTVVFESSAPLVPGDSNGKVDVYRWTKGQGVALISTGQAPADSYVYAVSPDARDILFVTPETLVPQSLNGTTPTLYDARVDGGFAAPETTVCTEDACQAAPATPPDTPANGSSAFTGTGNGTATTSSSNLRVIRRLLKGNTFVLTIASSSAGTVAVTGSGIRTVVKRLLRSGTYHLRVHLTARSLHALRSRSRLKTMVKLSFVPLFGRSTTKTVALTAHVSRAAAKSQLGGSK